MAITENASTPAVATATGPGTGSITSAAFSPPANSMLVALVAGGWGNSGLMSASVTDSTGGTWTPGPMAQGTSTGARGVVAMFRRYLPSAPGSMTVTGTITNLQGGRLLAVRVLDGADPDQTGAASVTKVASSASGGQSTNGTVSITTTEAGSQVYGISDDATNDNSWTANGATTALSGGSFVDATDSVTLVAWKATNATTTPGSIVLGGTWGATVSHNEAAWEIRAAGPTQTPTPKGIISEQRLGPVTTLLTQPLSPKGIPTRERFGPSAVALPPQVVSPKGILTRERFGTPTRTTAITLNPKSIPSGAVIPSGQADRVSEILAVTFWALNNDGTYNVPLPDVQSWSLSPVNGSPGAVTLDYPADGRNFNTLRDSVTQDRDLLIAIWVHGKDTGSFRAIVNTAEGDDVTESAVWRFSGNFLPVRLEEAVVAPRIVVVQPPTGPTPTTDLAALRVYSATVGSLMVLLMQEAHTRGVLTDIDYSFTPATDSHGIPWSTTVTLKIAPGTTYLKVLDALVAAQMCEWDVQWTGSQTELTIWDTNIRGTDFTQAADPLIWRAGDTLTESPRKHTVRDAGTTLVVAGGEGLYDTFEDATAIARRGRRIERFVSQGSFTDPGSLTAYGTAKLPEITAGSMEIGHGTPLIPGGLVPFVHYNVGDWVYSDTGRGLERLRIAQLTVASDEHGTITVGLSLNDLIADATQKLAQRIDGIESGTIVTGTSSPSTTQDTIPPAAPQGVGVTSLAQPTADVVPRAAVFVTWTQVTTNVDTTPITDLAGYVVQFRYLNPSLTNNWYDPVPMVDTAAAEWSGVIAGESIEIRVAAVDTSGNQSDWSTSAFHTTATDNTPPPVPSTPTVAEFLGTLTVTWDGLGSLGETMPPDFDAVEIHRSTTSNFTPDTSTFQELMFGPGGRNYTDLPYGVTQFFRLIAVDLAGNESAPSAQASGIPAEIGYGNIAFKDPGNLVEDGSFELPGSRATHLARSDTAWSFTNTTADLGSWSVLGTGATGSGERTLRLSPLIPSKAAIQYAAQLAIRRSTDCNGSLIIRLRFHLTGGTTQDLQVTYTTGETPNTWLAKTISYYTAPAGTETVEILAVLGTDMTAGTWGVDRVEVREVIGTLLVADAAITNAKVADMSVGKLTAGTITAIMLMAGLLRSGVTGLRYELDANGLRFYDASDQLVINFDTATASAVVTGTFQTGIAGRRAVLSGASNKLLFYPQVGETRFTSVESYIPGNYPDDIALELRAIDSDTTTDRARVFLLPDQVGMVVTPQNNDADAETGVLCTPNEVVAQIRTRVTTPGSSVPDGGYLFLQREFAHIGVETATINAWHSVNTDGIHDFEGKTWNFTDLGPTAAMLTGEASTNAGFGSQGISWGPTMASILIPVAALDSAVKTVTWCVQSNSTTGFTMAWSGTDFHWTRWIAWRV